MNGEHSTSSDAAKPETQSRQRSSIAFPYNDLKSGIELAEAIYNKVGLGECDDDQLAAWTNQSAKSSGFRVQVYAARMFGILSGEGSKHRVTDLGRAIVDPKRAREAKAEAFQKVPLYKAVFDKYKGGTIPPPAALERDFVSLGVAEKQKDRARQVFERSAEQAGYFEHGRDRLVAPGVFAGDTTPGEDTAAGGGGGGGSGGGGGGEKQRHPLIQGLVDSLPENGKTWTLDEAVDWLEAAAVNLRLVYKFKGSIDVSAKEPKAG